MSDHVVDVSDMCNVHEKSRNATNTGVIAIQRFVDLSVVMFFMDKNTLQTLL